MCVSVHSYAITYPTLIVSLHCAELYNQFSQRQITQFQSEGLESQNRRMSEPNTCPLRNNSKSDEAGPVLADRMIEHLLCNQGGSTTWNTGYRPCLLVNSSHSSQIVTPFVSIRVNQSALCKATGHTTVNTISTHTIKQCKECSKTHNCNAEQSGVTHPA